MSQTLGAYFKELRTSARRFPLVDRAEVEAMTAEQLHAEMTRRKWRVPLSVYQGMTPRHETWVKHFLKCQANQRCPTLADIAERAGISTATVCLLEQDGRGASPEVLRLALVKGLGYAPDAPEVSRALALLTVRATKGKMAVASVEADIAKETMQQSFRDFLDRAVPVLATIPASEYDAVLEALGNPAVVESLAGQNRLAAAGAKPKLKVLPKAEGQA